MIELMKIWGIRIFLPVSFYLFSCNPNIVGEYVGPTNSIKLNNDSTYIYKNSFDVFSHHSTGKWKHITYNQKDVIILNSDHDISCIQTRYVEYPISNSQDTVYQYNFEIESILPLKYTDFSHMLIIIDDSIELFLESNLKSNYLCKNPINKFRVKLVTNPLVFAGVNNTLMTEEYVIQEHYSSMQILVDIYDIADMLTFETYNNDSLFVKKKALFWKSKDINLSKKRSF